MKYVKPTTSGFGYTAGKLYQILLTYEGGQFVVKNDRGVNQIIRGDGKPSLRLERGGKFEIVDIPEPGEAQEYAVETAKKTSEAAQHKADCIKAEAIVDQLYDIFQQVRNPEQLIAAVRSSKIFADAFLELQKVK